MITYHYQCTNNECLRDTKVRRSIKDSPLKECPHCGKNTLNQIYYAVPVLDTVPKTIGGWADRNTEKAGQYEREERQHELTLRKQRARTEAINEMLPEGMESARPEKPVTPWWRPGTKGPDLNLSKLAPLSPGEPLKTEANNFIVNGDSTTSSD